MIKRELKPVTVISYSSADDAYGQPQTIESGRRIIDMVIKNYTSVETTDIRYRDTTNIGLTYDNSINKSDKVVSNNETYDVLYIIPSNRLNQVFLRKV